jgi:hypothetical protein
VNDVAALEEDASANFRTMPQDAEVGSETFRNVPQQDAATFGNEGKDNKNDHAKSAHENKIDVEKDHLIRELQQEIMDLKITNKGRDYFMEQVKNDHGKLIDITQQRNIEVGTLTELVSHLQLGAPRGSDEPRTMRDADAEE